MNYEYIIDTSMAENRISREGKKRFIGISSILNRTEQSNATQRKTWRSAAATTTASNQNKIIIYFSFFLSSSHGRSERRLNVFACLLYVNLNR